MGLFNRKPKWLKRCQVLEIKPNDRLVIMTDEALAFDQGLRLKNGIAKAVDIEPKQVLVLDSGLKLGIIRRIFG